MPKSRTSPRTERSLPEPIPFGQRIEDLDIEFDIGNRVELAVDIVVRFSAIRSDATASEDSWGWELPVGDRVLQLLRILQVSHLEPELSVVARCPVQRCKERLELDLPIQGLIEHAEQAASRGAALTLTTPDNRPIAFRRPSGTDQRNWLQQSFERQGEANEIMLRTLLVADSAPAAELDEVTRQSVSQAFMDFDPLVAFRVSTKCPACGRDANVPIDIERECLLRLARQQHALFDAVHRLASVYGWTESAVLQLSPSRRQRYLERIESENSPI